MPLVNLSFYRFLPLRDLAHLKADLLSFCAQQGLLGTILLAEEGVNVMLTGTPAAASAAREKFSQLFGPISCKEAPALDHSFERLLVKIKKEIISVGDPDLRPAEVTAPRLSAFELRRWIEEGHDFHFLDTRNAYEVEVGTFEGAIHLNLECSREFAEKARAYASEWKHKPVVTFCTGGIRCEKASAVLLKAGLENVYQLDGGILRYFEKNGAEHFRGNCFVYDWRLAVDGNLKPVPRADDPEKSFGRHKLS